MSGSGRGRGGGPTGQLLPPGEVTTVGARQALVLAPHYDDEVLGCGGLLARLAAGGTRVAVLFLTDGAGQPPAAAYAARRREESTEALAALGAEAAGHLDLPDGRLATHLADAERGIAEALAERAPDLVLVPSPLEVTADHRAAFAALHGVLGAVRGTSPPAAAAGRPAVDPELTVLVYEVNHPGYPDTLVDVGDELETIARAMACYASQQERHDYLAAGLGLRRFRTLSLPSEVRAAEGYRRLALADFTTRSPAQLVRHLGGEPGLLAVERGPLVSVVVRTRDRPDFLAQALASLAAGTYRQVEVVLVNDGGEAPAVSEDYPFALRRVDLAETRGRAAAANAGVAAATGEWIAFLDDDDLAAPEHLAVLVGAAAGAGVRVVYSDAAVVTYALDPGDPGGPDGADGTDGGGVAASGWREVARRLPYSRDFDPDLLALDNYIPFNTVLMEAALVGELASGPGSGDGEGEGPFDPSLAIFEDWDFLIRLARRAPFHHLPRVTCEYRHFEGAGHHALGGRPRERRDFLTVKARVLAKHRELLVPERLARAIDGLRAEAVAHGEAAARALGEGSEARERLARLEERYHRLNGEAVALRGEGERFAAERERFAADLERRDGERREMSDELHRLYRDEVELRGAVDSQTEHIGKLYAEIERLNGRLAELAGASLKEIIRWWREQRRPQG